MTPNLLPRRVAALPQRRRVAIAAVIALLAALACIATWLQTRATIKFDVVAASPVTLQVFHSSDGVFSEGASDTFVVSGGQRVRLRVPTGEAGRLRVDPAPGSAGLSLCALRVRDGTKSGYGIAAAHDVAVRAEGGCVSIVARPDAADPFIILAASAPVQRTGWIGWSVLAGAALAILGIALLWLLRMADARDGRLASHATRIFDTCSRHAHRLAFVLLVIFGSLIAHALPPNGVPDEVTHLSKIAKVQAGALLTDSGTVPVVGVAEMYGPLWDDVQRPGPLDRQRLDTQRGGPLACNRAVRALPTSADQYAPHLYAAPALVLTASCAIGTSFGTFLDAARIINLLLGACLIAFGIRHAAYGKWALFTVALLPMTLSQVASISADSLTLSLSFCFIGLVSGITGGTFSVARARVVLPLIALMLAFSKPGSAWVLVSVLFCWRACAPRRFGEIALSAMVIPWVVHIAWTLWSAGNAHYGPGVDPELNRALLVEDPASVAGLWWNTFFGAGASGMYQSLVGRLGWLDVPLSPWAYSAAGAILFASLWTNPAGTRIPVPTRAFSVAAATGSLALLSLPLFLTWTHAGAVVIQGLQGRYFLPTLAFLLVFGALRAGPVVRVVLLACVLCVPVLAFDAENHIQARYYGHAR